MSGLSELLLAGIIVTAAAAAPAPAAGLPVTGLFSPLEWFGEWGLFCWKVLKSVVRPPFEFRELIRQMDAIGPKSLPLISLAGAATGVVMSMEMRDSLGQFGARSLLPAVIVFSLVKETGPVITALVFSGRVGAGIGAELGSMKVTEQIDALEASAVSPYHYLAATRVVACLLMLPLLTLASDFCGIMCGWIAETLAEPITFRVFIDHGFRSATFSDLLPAVLKTAVFGLIIGLVSCFQGMQTRGGTEGVGRAATSAVFLSSLFVILADVVLVRLNQILFP